MAVTYRTFGTWGPGKGSNLLPSEVDINFWTLSQQIVDLQTNPALPNGIQSITVSGTQMTITLADGTVLGPYPLPVLAFHWRGEWAPSQPYFQLDVFSVQNAGIFLVTIPHTSGATFDPNLADGSGNPVLQQLFGSTDATLSGLSDVQITEPLSRWDALLWEPVDGKWENEQLGSMAFQDPASVAITGGTITGMPTPVNPSDVATKAYADSAGGGGATAANLTMLANISGATAAMIPHTLSDFLDAVFGTTVRGSMMIRSGSGWVALAPGLSGQFLQTQGPGIDPLWSGGMAGVSALYSGTGITLSPATIIATGTVALAALPDGYLLANISGASAAPVPVTLAQFLDHVLGTARGTLITRTSTAWVALTPGTAGQYLKTQGLGADLMWDSPAGAGTVVSVAAGTGISTGGAPITGSGTVSLAAIADGDVLANTSGSSAAPIPTTLTALWDHVFGATQGAVVYRSATAWVMLTPGTSGQVLTTGGSGANPAWAAAPSGGPIGTDQLLANLTAGSAVPVGHTLSDIFDAVISSSRGTMFFRGASGWTALAPGTSGQVLTSGGVSSDPHWTPGSAAALAGLSDVTITSPANQDQLTYISSASKWQNKTLASVLDAAFGNSAGSILYRGSSAWSARAAGRSSYYGLAGPDASWQPFGGFKWHQAVSVATTGPIAGTMTLGSSGGTIGGTTFTCAANGPITIDGKLLDGIAPDFGVGCRVLFKDQSNGAQNLIWVLTTIGTVSTPSVFTAATDFDDTNYFGGGDIVAVGTGTVNYGQFYMSQVGSSFVLGTSVIGWILCAGVSTTMRKYNIGCYVPGAMTANQNLLFHKFSKAVTIPAGFGAFQGHVSEAGGATAATASTTINVAQAVAATPTTFTNVGTVVFAAAGASATFTTTGGAALSFSQGDVLRLRAPATPDATLADFFATLVGYET